MRWGNSTLRNAQQEVFFAPSGPMTKRSPNSKKPGAPCKYRRNTSGTITFPDSS